MEMSAAFLSKSYYPLLSTRKSFLKIYSVGDRSLHRYGTERNAENTSTTTQCRQRSLQNMSKDASVEICTDRSIGLAGNCLKLSHRYCFSANRDRSHFAMESVSVLDLTAFPLKEQNQSSQSFFSLRQERTIGRYG